MSYTSKLRVFAIFLCFCFKMIDIPSYAASNIFTVSGKIVDSLNIPVPFTAVCLLHPENDSLIIATISDTSGNFSISCSTPGNYNLRISSFTFKPKNLHIELIPGKNELVLGNIQLSGNIIYIEEVSVTGEQNKLDYRVDKLVFTPDSMNLAKSVKGTDLLNFIPGVTVSPIDQSIRVKGNDNVLVLVDGRTSDKQLSTIHSSEIKQVEIISNPSTRYNSEIDNIVNIVLKEEKNKGIQIAFNLEPSFKNVLFFGTLALDYQNKNTRFFLKYNHSAQNMTTSDSSTRIDSYDNLKMRYNTYPVKDQFLGARFHIIDYGMDYSVNHRNFFNITCKYFQQDVAYETFEGLSSFTNDSLLARSYFTSSANSKNINQNYSFFYKRTLTNPGHEFWLSSNTFLLNRTNTDDYSSGETEIWNNHSETRTERTLNNQKSNDTRLEYFYSKSNIKIESGYHFYFRTINNKLYSPVSDEYFIYSDIRHAGFANMVFRKNIFSVQTGARFEYTSYQINQTKEDDFLYPLFSLSSAYDLKKGNTFRFTYNRRLTYPGYRLLIPFTYYAADSLSSRMGNSHLRPTVADKLELAFSTEQDAWSFSISATSKKYKDYIATQYSVINGILSSEYHNFSDILTAGGEFSLSASLFYLEINIDGNLYYWDFPGTDHDGLSHILYTELIAYLPWDITAGMEFEFFDKTLTPYGYRKFYNPFEYFYVEKPLFKNKASVSFFYLYPFSSDKSETIMWNNYFTETEYEYGKDFIIGIDFSFFFNQGEKISAAKSKLHMEHDEEKR